MAFSKKNHSTHSTPPTPPPLHTLHSTELFKIFFSLLTLSTAFLQKACGPGKNNKSTIINLQDSDKNGSHWVSYKKIGNKIFYFDSYAVAFIPNIIKNQYPNHKFICNIYRIQSIDSNQCGRFCILFVRGNIKNENEYNNFLLQFRKK